MEGYSIKCNCHNYITLFWNDKLIHCYDNGFHDNNSQKDGYYTEHIIASIEKRTKMKIIDIPIIGRIEDFDGLRFLYGGFKKGFEWLNKNQETNKKVGDMIGKR